MEDTLAFFRRDREERKVAKDKLAIYPTLSYFQKLGAATMVLTGQTINTFVSHDHPGNRLNPLHRHAYDPRAGAARRLWASIAKTTIIAGGAGVARLAAAVDDDLACVGSGETTTRLEADSTIASLAAEVPHNNTPIKVVIKEIIDRNEEKFGGHLNYEDGLPNNALPGLITIPQNCSSLI